MKLSILNKHLYYDRFTPNSYEALNLDDPFLLWLIQTTVYSILFLLYFWTNNT